MRDPGRPIWAADPRTVIMSISRYQCNYWRSTSLISAGDQRPIEVLWVPHLHVANGTNIFCMSILIFYQLDSLFFLPSSSPASVAVGEAEAPSRSPVPSSSSACPSSSPSSSSWMSGMEGSMGRVQTTQLEYFDLGLSIKRNLFPVQRVAKKNVCIFLSPVAPFFSHPAGLPETELFLWTAW